MNKIQNVSCFYKTYLDTISDFQKAYQYAFNKVNETDKATQDLLHQLELGSVKERNKTATLLSKVRKERRYYKDIVTVLQPLMDLVGTAEAERFFNLFKSKTLGETRKAEKMIENRQYFPRVVTDIEIAKLSNNGEKV